MTQYTQLTRDLRDEQQHMQRYSRMHSDKLLVPPIRSEMCQSDQAMVPLSVENRSAVDSEEFKVKQLYNQLQEKSTELTSLLTRLRQIID